MVPFIRCFLWRCYLSYTQKANLVLQRKLNKRQTLQESRGNHSDRNRVQQIIQRQLLKAPDLNAVTATVRGKKGKRLVSCRFYRGETAQGNHCFLVMLHVGSLRKRRKDTEEQSNTWHISGHTGCPRSLCLSNLWFLAHTWIMHVDMKGHLRGGPYSRPLSASLVTSAKYSIWVISTEETMPPHPQPGVYIFRLRKGPDRKELKGE